ncbi:hypothetical protein MNEG_6542 [Monoraphidium neglectum]|uniref:Uncharacterized protein n=1 Tax=Monoraphidium neglectum TaxID=145388 RepID=A0A0D2JQP6_9CHLO|nr:hypothetical protein MNEG_6542 [Monoraphidium neglectum]KIZ01423.1 hypothetical protein MNEG_6542 [Monoraphidium neglectum]|eukprot:XP_013900442.1 hypothetical protein MNEG_6542 [Monoraphidium neglectum]
MSVEDYISTSLSDTYSNIKHKATFIAWVTAGISLAMSDDGAGAPAAAEAAKKHKHVPNPRRRAKLKQAAAADDAQQLPPEERKRRAEQRRRREIALNVRAAGKTYNPHKLRKSQGGGAGGGDAAGGGVKKVKRADRVKLKAGKAHRCSHHAIVLPIYWNQRAKEKQDVLGAAQRAADALRGAGLDVAVDEGDKYTPGQKVRPRRQRLG